MWCSASASGQRRSVASGARGSGSPGEAIERVGGRHAAGGEDNTPYYDRTNLIHVTTDTVRENLLAGMALVTLVLFMFLTNVRGALIVAINIPLALLFAFAVLFTAR